MARGQPIPVETLAQIAADYCAGRKSLVQLAEVHQVNYQTLKGRAMELGWGPVRRANRAALINPPSTPLQLDHQRLFESQIRFQQSVPDQINRAMRGLLRLAGKAEKAGEFKDAGYLLKSYADVAVMSKCVLGIEFAEKVKLLELEKGLKSQGQAALGPAMDAPLSVHEPAPAPEPGPVQPAENPQVQEPDTTTGSGPAA